MGFLTTVILTPILTIGVYFASPVILGYAGLTALGPVAGSLFAGAQGAGILSGSLMATAQSIAMTTAILPTP